MASKTKVEWTATRHPDGSVTMGGSWNPVTGCTKSSPGCKHCYAEREWVRLSANRKTRYYGRKFTDVACHEEVLDLPLRWKRGRNIFVNSMADLFHPAVPFEFLDKVFAVMALASQHTFQILTKYPERMYAYMTSRGTIPARSSADGPDVCARDGATAQERVLEATAHFWRDAGLASMPEAIAWPLPNVNLGVSVENQQAADERIAPLLRTPAAVRWISVEPLLGPVNVSQYLNGLDLVVVGGESGPKARPMHPDFVRSLRGQCETAGVRFFFKQWGEWGTVYQRGDGTPVFRQFDNFQQWVNKAQTWVNGGICLDRHGHEMKNGADMMRARDAGDFPITIMHRVGRKAAGRLLDGKLYDGLMESQA